jgi:hypothetical protein
MQALLTYKPQDAKKINNQGGAAKLERISSGDFLPRKILSKSVSKLTRVRLYYCAATY